MSFCCISRRKGNKDVDVLSYGDGKIRTYEPNAIDSRIKGVKLVQTRQEVIDHLRTSEEHILIPVRLAKILFGWKEDEFDQNT